MMGWQKGKSVIYLLGADEMPTADHHSRQAVVCCGDLRFSMLVSQTLKY